MVTAMCGVQLKDRKRAKNRIGTAQLKDRKRAKNRMGI